jgi:ribosomal protein L24E
MIKEIVLLQRKPGAPGNPPRRLVIECDSCHVIFERPNSTEFTKKTRHFCSSECWYSTSRGSKGSHGGEMITKLCSHCGKDVNRLASQSHGKLYFFCNLSCVSEYKKIHQDPRAIAALKRTTDDPEFRAFMSANAKERFARDGHPWQDRKHTDETKQKLRLSHAISGRSKGQNNGMYERGHTEVSKEKMSESHSKNLIEGKGFIYGATGHTSGWAYFFEGERRYKDVLPFVMGT